MGYTHYFSHTRRFTNAEWLDVKTDLATIVAQAEDDGIRIGDNFGNPAATVPNVDKDGKNEFLGFNGLGDDALETFMIWQNRRPKDEWQDAAGRDFCKTERKPYDAAVTACLIYLDSVYPERFTVGSDGMESDWQAGLDLARRAIPRLGNVLRIPRPIVFDSQFSRYIAHGGKLAMAYRTTGELVMVNTDSLWILGTFPDADVAGDNAREWAETRAAKMAEDRRRRLPCAVKTLDRWQARQMREIHLAAEIHGFLTGDPECFT